MPLFCTVRITWGGSACGGAPSPYLIGIYENAARSPIEHPLTSSRRLLFDNSRGKLIIYMNILLSGEAASLDQKDTHCQIQKTPRHGL